MREILISKFKTKRSVSADKAACRLTFLVIAMAALPFTASAAAVITEIMYDAPGTDTGREWIEVENNGDAAIDLSAWKLFEATTNHKITAIASPSLPPHGLAIIADNPDKFRADNPNFSGLLFDSAFSLGNDGETIVLRDDAGGDVDSVTYMPAWGAAGDGNSLQKSASGVWISAPLSLGLPAAATESVSPPALPGDAPVSSSSPPSAEADPDTGDLSVHSSPEPANTLSPKPEFEVTAGRSRLGFVGSPLRFEAKATLSKSMPPGTGVISTWSMGDGTELYGQTVLHAYSFAGDYIVVTNSEANGEHAVSKTKVKIVEPNIGLVLGDGGVIELVNAGKGEINLGGFIVEDGTRRFILPQDTILSPRLSLKLPPALTGISFPRDFLRLANPTGTILSSISLYEKERLIALPPGMSAESLRQNIIKSLASLKK